MWAGSTYEETLPHISRANKPKVQKQDPLVVHFGKILLSGEKLVNAQKYLSFD